MFRKGLSSKLIDYGRGKCPYIPMGLIETLSESLELKCWTTVERWSFYANKQLTGSCNAVNLDFRPQVQRHGLATFVALGHN
uniref:HDC08796 n=1 Tax=Drosophila melanogaster TaxID=7227 RepID=Q6ILP4_DROME|nr:TPA_inf: HDC08796 [Drosophila melanogaster]